MGARLGTKGRGRRSVRDRLHASMCRDVYIQQAKALSSEGYSQYDIIESLRGPGRPRTRTTLSKMLGEKLDRKGQSAETRELKQRLRRERVSERRVRIPKPKRPQARKIDVRATQSDELRAKVAKIAGEHDYNIGRIANALGENAGRVHEALRQGPPRVPTVAVSERPSIKDWLKACKAMECHRLAREYNAGPAEVSKRHGAGVGTRTVTRMLETGEAEWRRIEKRERPAWLGEPHTWEARALGKGSLEKPRRQRNAKMPEDTTMAMLSEPDDPYAKYDDTDYAGSVLHDVAMDSETNDDW